MPTVVSPSWCGAAAVKVSTVKSPKWVPIGSGLEIRPAHLRGGAINSDWTPRRDSRRDSYRVGVEPKFQNPPPSPGLTPAVIALTVCEPEDDLSFRTGPPPLLGISVAGRRVQRWDEPLSEPTRTATALKIRRREPQPVGAALADSEAADYVRSAGNGWWAFLPDVDGTETVVAATMPPAGLPYRTEPPTGTSTR
jgi:hypothetical protein